MLRKALYCIVTVLLAIFALPPSALPISGWFHYQDYLSDDYWPSAGWLPLVELGTEGERVRGAVQSMTVTKAPLSMQYDALTEGKEIVVGTLHYDIQGRRGEATIHYPGLSEFTKNTYIYDGSGKLTEITTRRELDQKVGPAIRTMFAYTGDGLLSEVTVYTAVRLDQKILFSYDHGRLRQVTLWMNGGAQRLDWQCVSEDRDMRVRAQIHVKQDWVDWQPEFGGATIYTFDPSGNLVARIIYESRDAEKYKNPVLTSKTSYAYEYDTTGNWIKRTESRWVTKFGQSYYEPQIVLHRKIIYYGADKKRPALTIGSYIIVRETNLLQEPREGSSQITTLRENTRVNVVAIVKGKWLKIESSHAARPPGYVRAEDVGALQENSERTK